ncbi:molybdopterin-guanine dinucleotide biosynthesis protein B [Niameybacter massiliensis]|uniref:molybdopterin-guanine dinucleotide biosynthesis protein B n=1 Tax=Niameybacter massiliensis TaxID=1658108 RepID=UPI0006B60CAF|nr:molybdopterin-guanine dinucleotide biosynthesis protein B [Niameybacter massiliensis]
MKKVAGVIVAGGKSSRMGTDKMYLTYEGESFIDTIVNSLQPASSVYVVLNDQQDYVRKEVVILSDLIKEIGPIGGLYTALASVVEDYVYLWACDMPNHCKDFMNYVLSYVEEDLYDAYVICMPDGKISPFGSVYHKRILPKLKTYIKQEKYKMVDFIESLHIKKIYLNYTCFDPSRIFMNINTPIHYVALTKECPSYIAISGSKNSGKTTLMTNLIGYFTAKGLQVGTIKHDGHLFEADVKGTDSYRHKQAGAARTLVYDTEKLCLVKDQQQQGIETLLAYFSGMDLVLLEGFKESVYPKIEVVREATHIPPVCNPETVLAYASDYLLDTTIQQYELQDIEALARVIENYLKRSK